MRKKNISFALALVLMKGVAFAQTNTKTTETKTPPPTEVRKETITTDKKSETTPPNDLNRNPKTYADADLVNEKPLKDRKPGERVYEYKGTKYSLVPLIGDLDYFGKNHDAMLDYTKKYMSSRKKTFEVVMQRNINGKIFAMMDKVFDKYDIPHELKYLSVIESALNNKALSPVGAYGPWQFMPSTGRMMGLKVGSSLDERSDWVKSTHAACKYLNYLYNMFDDWLLVIAAYNSGPRPVLNAMNKTGKNDFWSIKKYLPSETQNHVMAFVATATAFELLPMFATTGVPADFDWKKLNKKVNGVGSVENKKPEKQRFTESELKNMTIFVIKEPLNLEFICKTLDIDLELMFRWNYDYFLYLEEYKKGDTYKLRMPKKYADDFLNKKDYIEKHSLKLLEN